MRTFAAQAALVAAQPEELHEGLRVLAEEPGVTVEGMPGVEGGEPEQPGGLDRGYALGQGTRTAVEKGPGLPTMPLGECLPAVAGQERNALADALHLGQGPCIGRIAGDTGPGERLQNRRGLGPRAHNHGHVAQGHLGDGPVHGTVGESARQCLDLPGDELAGPARTHDADRLAAADCRDRLGPGEGVGRLGNGPAEAVGGSQAYRGASWMVPGEVVEGRGAAAPEPVDGLVRVADDHDAGRIPRECLEEGILERVDVLELVHHDMVPSLRARTGLHEPQRLFDESLVGIVALRLQDGKEPGLLPVQGSRRALAEQEIVHPCFHVRIDGRGGHLLQHGLVGHFEVDACLPEDPGGKGMEGTDLDGCISKPLRDLPRRTGGEGDGQDVRLRAFHERPDALHQDPGLAGSRSAGYHHNPAVHGKTHGFFLKRR